MSTRLTQDQHNNIRVTDQGTPMVDSQALQLVLAAGEVADLTSRYLSAALKSMGYQKVTASLLSFLSALECGINYGSEIARNLGVSRQMVAKTVRELCSAGYLEQRDGVGKQKQIVFTLQGEELMADARRLLADMDKLLTEQVPDTALRDTLGQLAKLSELLKSLESE